jgi:hypothetical protein
VQYLFVSLPNDLDSVAFGPGSVVTIEVRRKNPSKLTLQPAATLLSYASAELCMTYVATPICDANNTPT